MARAGKRAVKPAKKNKKMSHKSNVKRDTVKQAKKPDYVVKKTVGKTTGKPIAVKTKTRAVARTANSSMVAETSQSTSAHQPARRRATANETTKRSKTSTAAMNLGRMTTRSCGDAKTTQIQARSAAANTQGATSASPRTTAAAAASSRRIATRRNTVSQRNEANSDQATTDVILPNGTAPRVDSLPAPISLDSPQIVDDSTVVQEAETGVEGGATPATVSASTQTAQPVPQGDPITVTDTAEVEDVDVVNASPPPVTPLLPAEIASGAAFYDFPVDYLIRELLDRKITSAHEAEELKRMSHTDARRRIANYIHSRPDIKGDLTNFMAEAEGEESLPSTSTNQTGSVVLSRPGDPHEPVSPSSSQDSIIPMPQPGSIDTTPAPSLHLAGPSIEPTTLPEDLAARVAQDFGSDSMVFIRRIVQPSAQPPQNASSQPAAATDASDENGPPSKRRAASGSMLALTTDGTAAASYSGNAPRSNVQASSPSALRADPRAAASQNRTMFLSTAPIPSLAPESPSTIARPVSQTAQLPVVVPSAAPFSSPAPPLMTFRQLTQSGREEFLMPHARNLPLYILETSNELTRGAILSAPEARSQPSTSSTTQHSNATPTMERSPTLQ